MEVTIIDAGMGNLRSISNALAAVGGDVCVTSEPAAILRSSRLVVPGVGAFGRCMTVLNEQDLLLPLQRQIDDGCPVLGICLGFQVLFEGSSEHGEHSGLSRLPGRIEPFDDTELVVPHMGWNQVRQTQQHAIFDGIASESHFYFVHSFRPVDTSSEHTLAVADYGDAFVCGVVSDNLLGFQFHPEKSGPVGLRLLKNFLKWNPK